jgi:hypothetical protein
MPNAMYCLKGHFVKTLNPRLSMGQLRALMAQAENDEKEGTPRLQGFCTICGASNISACQHCRTAIEGYNRSNAPGYCGGCGKPFPWTEAALLAAREFTDDLDELSPEEKVALRDTFPDLIIDTARTPLAVSRFKKLMIKAGPLASAALRKTIDIALAETARRMIGKMI